MFHDQHVLINGIHLRFCFFLCPAQSLMGMSGVSSFPVQSGGSLNIFSSSLGIGIKL